MIEELITIHNCLRSCFQPMVFNPVSERGMFLLSKAGALKTPDEFSKNRSRKFVKV